jgi:hypothetical protein
VKSQPPLKGLARGIAVLGLGCVVPEGLCTLLRWPVRRNTFEGRLLSQKSRVKCDNLVASSVLRCVDELRYSTSLPVKQELVSPELSLQNRH